MSDPTHDPQPRPSDDVDNDLGAFRGVVLDSSTTVEPVPEPPTEPAQPPAADPTQP